MWRSTIEKWGERYNIGRDRIYFLISGPSGAGKTTIVRSLLSKELGLKKLITTTTREKRQNERNGEDYHFVNENEFSRMIDEGSMIEWKYIFGQYYGLSKDELTRYLEHDVIFDLDVQGKDDFIKKTTVDCVTIFLIPPSVGSIRERLKLRNDLTDDLLEDRVKRLNNEVARASDYQYIVENKDLNKAINQVQAIIQASRSNRDMRLLERIYANVLDENGVD